DGEVAEDDVTAVLEGDGLVGYAGLLGLIHGIVAAFAGDIGGCAGRSRRSGRRPGRTTRTGSKAEALAVDEAGAGDGNIVNAFAPDEGVVPVIVSVVLEGVVG